MRVRMRWVRGCTGNPVCALCDVMTCSTAHRLRSGSAPSPVHRSHSGMHVELLAAAKERGGAPSTSGKQYMVPTALAIMAEWRSTAPFGTPVVPLV